MSGEDGRVGARGYRNNRLLTDAPHPPSPSARSRRSTFLWSWDFFVFVVFVHFDFFFFFTSGSLASPPPISGAATQRFAPAPLRAQDRASRRLTFCASNFLATGARAAPPVRSPADRYPRIRLWIPAPPFSAVPAAPRSGRAPRAADARRDFPRLNRPRPAAPQILERR
jgi:hypothetical protein